MAFFFFPSFLQTPFLLLTLFSILIFFLLLPPFHHSPFPNTPHRSLSAAAATTCSSSAASTSLINYSSLHTCVFNQNPFLSIPFLCLFLLLHFHILIHTAQSHFSILTTKLSSRLKLTPSLGAITLLALGNGAPDVFSSVAALRGGQYRTGFGAILSAGTFVSGLVVGFVAIYAAPFGLNAASFVRDVLFYMISVLFLFWVYLSGEIFLWQAIGFVGFYAFFVGFVVWTDLGLGGGDGGKGKVGVIGNEEEMRELVEVKDCAIGEVSRDLEMETPGSGICGVLIKISKAWELPISIMLKLTIPQTAPSEWNRFYTAANITLCPLALLYACNSLMPMDHPIVFILSDNRLPLWFVVLLASSSLSILHFIMEKEPPKTEQMPVMLVAFVMSVFWISTVAGELLNCLAALGALLKLPSALLGLTVLAWGNSVGDLVADVAVAKAGQPAMAMAGCFACPMFNMLVGLGTALVIQTAKVYPQAYELHFNMGIVIAFVFLLLSLMGSLLVITWHRFRVPRFWGFCLVGLYVFFMAISLIIAKFSG